MKFDLSKPRDRVFLAINNERDRQEVKFPGQRLPYGTGFLSRRQTRLDNARFQNEYGPTTWTSVLEEEFYEAVLETDLTKLRTELIQVAAVAARWVEYIDREGK